MESPSSANDLAAKIVLDLPKHPSATETLDQLDWDNLTKRRRLHRFILLFKVLNGLIDWGFEFYSFKDIHNYNTWGNNNICRRQSRRSWGQSRFIYQAANDWNILPNVVKQISDILYLNIRGILSFF